MKSLVLIVIAIEEVSFSFELNWNGIELETHRSIAHH